MIRSLVVGRGQTKTSDDLTTSFAWIFFVSL
jgi:hypothetical protein